MSLDDYREAVRLHGEGVSFDALVMAAMLKADPRNSVLLQQSWPHVRWELSERHGSSDGRLEDG